MYDNCVDAGDEYLKTIWLFVVWLNGNKPWWRMEASRTRIQGHWPNALDGRIKTMPFAQFTIGSIEKHFRLRSMAQNRRSVTLTFQNGWWDAANSSIIGFQSPIFCHSNVFLATKRFFDSQIAFWSQFTNRFDTCERFTMNFSTIAQTLEIIYTKFDLKSNDKQFTNTFTSLSWILLTRPFCFFSFFLFLFFFFSIFCCSCNWLRWCYWRACNRDG